MRTVPYIGVFLMCLSGRWAPWWAPGCLCIARLSIFPQAGWSRFWCQAVVGELVGPGVFTLLRVGRVASWLDQCKFSPTVVVGRPTSVLFWVVSRLLNPFHLSQGFICPSKQRKSSVAQSVAWPTCSPWWESIYTYLLFFTEPSRAKSYDLMSFSILPS